MIFDRDDVVYYMVVLPRRHGQRLQDSKVAAAAGDLDATAIFECTHWDVREDPPDYSFLDLSVRVATQVRHATFRVVTLPEMTT